MRGILGTKLGMTQIFDDNARVVPVTVIEAGPCTVTQVKTAETDGYRAVQLAYGSRKRVNKPLAGHLAKAGLDSAREIAELRLDDSDALPEPGDAVTVDLFSPGEYVDVTGTSKGKGTAGVIKRHNYHGLAATHGTKKKGRQPGAIGGCATPSRTFKGHGLAGRMGGERVTVQSLLVAGVDAERNLLLVKGGVPGSNGSVVLVRGAAKRPATEVGEA